MASPSLLRCQALARAQGVAAEVICSFRDRFAAGARLSCGSAKPPGASAAASAASTAGTAQVASSVKPEIPGQAPWWVSFAAAAAALGGVTFGSPLIKKPVEAEAAPSAAAAQAGTGELIAWLRDRGSRLEGIEVASSGQAGLGAFATGKVLKENGPGWLGGAWGFVSGRRQPRLLAAFPTDGAITADSAACDSTTAGRSIRQLMGTGLLDEETAVMAHLMLERARGDMSPLAPWLKALPAGFSTTLYFGEKQMEELKGTSLYAATKAKQRQLREQWARLQPAMHNLTRAEGITKVLSFDDFLWAFTVFWSRALNLPVLVQNAGNIKPSLEMRVAIVPGLDFCNHSASNNATWEVGDLQGERNREGGGRPFITLTTQGRKRLGRGEEITISYGDKSNEELLFHYGFAEKDNPHDMLMVHCPIPPQDEWDEVLYGRMMLLMARGLVPRFFLPVMDAKVLQTGHLTLPDEVWGILEVFVMDPKRLAAAMEAAGVGSQGTSPAGSALEGKFEPKDPGERMAILSTLAKILEYKIISMEGEEGTGTLEADIQLLEDAVPASPDSKRGSSFLYALEYRATQKKIARQYLGMTRRALQEVMSLLAED